MEITTTDTTVTYTSGPRGSNTFATVKNGDDEAANLGEFNMDVEYPEEVEVELTPKFGSDFPIQFQTYSMEPGDKSNHSLTIRRSNEHPGEFIRSEITVKLLNDRETVSESTFEVYG